ncbi:AAA family ATPase [Mesomycoplasma ovipneumoniae]|uniref:AAA family ATPase n=1 Tax=Mesomycoplasma ovipneumoniae TaxID=29562 RepID=UPI0028AA07A9|nr:AAA family ATPase [Mesomycoplasma ovipneumoniae]WNM14967.1 AAA family ATPase [Mesomycoplasma ovipneumoniae]
MAIKTKEKQKIENIAEKLTEEQQNVVNLALKGENILVDACIGSGKTSVIQVLCDKFPIDKKILYLTYNKLLKVEAKNKIKNKNVLVQNYHGFAYRFLWEKGINSSSADSIKIFLRNNISVDTYDVLLIDEYQDITEEISFLLEKIKEKNPNIQIVAVGDINQKIYDKTKLNVTDFIDKFLGSYTKTSLTFSFRMPKEHADMLGRIWDKTINGVNENCQIQYMEMEEIQEFLATQKPADILCLGYRSGKMTELLNYLEENHSDIFNKKTVFASIREKDANLSPKKNSAIFTTYDSSKGLEKPICVVFDFDLLYWKIRLSQITANYEIVKNIFCVAASRGKEKIIFLKPEFPNLPLNEVIIKQSKYLEKWSEDSFAMSTMFDHKYEEDIEYMLQMLDIKKIKTEDKSEIKVKTQDALIDLTPCVGIFLEASYFNDWQIDKEIRHFIELKYDHSEKKQKQQFKEYENYIKERNSIKDLTLFLVYLQTDQERYIKQTQPDFVDDNAVDQMHKRLSKVLGKDEIIQQKCWLKFSDDDLTIRAEGIADVIKNDIVYELKFVSDLTTAHFLQTASYMLALKKEKGILWNIRNNEMHEIRIKNREEFSEKLAQTISKGVYKPKSQKNLRNQMETIKKQIITNVNKNIAVIDVETNYDNEVFSVGVVIADSADFQWFDKEYWIIENNLKVGGMYARNIWVPLPLEFREEINVVKTRQEMIAQLIHFLKSYKVKNWFSYTKYDFRHLPELHKSFEHNDISIFAKSKQFNKHIPLNAVTTKKGDLKSGWNAQNIYRMLTKDQSYIETHNALLDAMDELRIMELLDLDIETFLNPDNNKEKTTSPKKINLTKASLNKKSTKSTKSAKSTKRATTVKSTKSTKTTKSKNLILN